MNLFLAGASGLVGAAFARAAARRGHRVVGTVGEFTGQIEGLAATLRLDLAQPETTTSAVLEEFPSAIVNCAAISRPDQCSADPARAQAINVALPTLLAQLAHHVSARFVHISSEQVFDGTQRTPYGVGDVPHPINLYGRQKLESEQAVLAAAPDFASVVRVPLLLGNSVRGHRSQHEVLFHEWAAGRVSRLFVDEFRQPCTAENLAEVLLELCERTDLRGLLHWAGRELLSRHEIGVRVREHFKLTAEEAPLRAVTRADHPEAQRSRQACLALDLAPLAGRLKTQPQSWTEQAEELNVPPACREWYHRR